MNIELKQAAQDAAEAIDWLLKNIRLNAPQLSGKAMGNAEKCASALRAALAQQTATPEPVWFHKHWGDDDDIFYRPDDKIPSGSTPLYTRPASSVPDGWQVVPIEPTAEMLQAALKVATPGALRAAWARMLAASTEQKS